MLHPGMGDETTFYGLSRDLTGFDEVALRGTGRGEEYLAELERILPPDVPPALLAAYGRALEDYPDDRDLGIQVEILGDPRLGPVARNLIFMWYTGTWQQLPDAWRAAYGISAADAPHVVSSEAYREGLVWQAIGAHPAGAKQQGYGSWAFPPAVRESAADEARS